MKKLNLLISITLLTALIPVLPVSAHVLRYDGSIGAVLHIDPNDDPVALDPSNFYFEFKDTQNKFSPTACDCLVTITENGQTLLSQQLFQNNSAPSLTNASLTFTFPKKDVYELNVIGKPVAGSDFQTFHLQYDIRVANIDLKTTSAQLPATNAPPNWFMAHLVHFIGGFIIVGFIIIAAIKDKFFSKNKT